MASLSLSLSFFLSFLYSLVDDRVVVRPGDGTPSAPPKKFRGNHEKLGGTRHEAIESSPCTFLIYFS